MIHPNSRLLLFGTQTLVWNFYGNNSRTTVCIGNIYHKIQRIKKNVLQSKHDSMVLEEVELHSGFVESREFCLQIASDKAG